MKQLEDRIKERLEGYESSLPEGDLAEFKALLDKPAAVGEKRTSKTAVWLIPSAVAAGLALFFIIGRDPKPDMIHVVDNGGLIADVIEPVIQEIVENKPDTPSMEKVARKSKISAVSVSPAKTVDETSKVDPVAEEQTSETVKEQQKRTDNHYDSETVRDNGYASPFVPAGNARSIKPVSVKVGQAAAGVLGGTGALALAGVLPTLLVENEIPYSGGQQSSEVVNPGGDLTDPEPPVDSRTSHDTHHMPLRAGLSLRIPFNDRWSLTTGLDYSWYSSSIEYSLSGNHKQNVHYLGIPVRADFTIARNRWMDVYVGAGASADFCVAAFDDGKKIARDGVGFSLIGAGGIQFNINKNLGLFLDPTFSWNIPSENRRLETYKTEFPFMFSVSTGLRVTLKGRD